MCDCEGVSASRGTVRLVARLTGALLAGPLLTPEREGNWGATRGGDQTTPTNPERDQTREQRHRPRGSRLRRAPRQYRELRGGGRQQTLRRGTEPGGSGGQRRRRRRTATWSGGGLNSQQMEGCGPLKTTIGRKFPQTTVGRKFPRTPEGLTDKLTQKNGVDPRAYRSRG